MKITITMPQLGLTMTEGTVSSWFKKPGDTVKKDEAILSVSTDKVDMDVEATAAGVLREIVVPEGQTVAVGTPIAYLETAESESSLPIPTGASSPVPVEEALPNKHQGKPQGKPQDKPQDKPKDEPSASSRDSEQFASQAAATEAHRDAHLRVSPRARRRARELGIDIATLRGSGPDGRIVEDDLLKIATKQSLHPAGDREAARRQLIADRMVESITTIPHFSVSVEVNAERLVALYESLREPTTQEAKVKLTYTDILLKLLALALAATPEMNCVWEKRNISRRTAIDIALAVATDCGVVAPVLKDLDRLSIEQVGILRSTLADKARRSRLAFTDVEGGVGTLSNLGMYRVDRFEGLISPGQSFILAVGRLRNRPWVETSLVIKPTLVLNLSVDHRIADGAIAASFLERIAEAIESPYQSLSNADRE